jgi:hypothetical protein
MLKFNQMVIAKKRWSRWTRCQDVNVDKMVKVDKMLNVDKMVKVDKTLNVDKMVKVAKMLNVNKMVNVDKILNVDKMVKVDKMLNMDIMVKADEGGLGPQAYKLEKEQRGQAGQARGGQKLCNIGKQHTMKELKQKDVAQLTQC